MRDVIETNRVRATAPVIVVGVDGSAASKDAVRWAAKYADLAEGQLHAVSAWQWPVSMLGAVVLPEGYDPEADARVGLKQILAEVLGDGPSAAVSTQIVHGPAGPALIDASASADLLVVGSRGHGAFAEMLLGSTSEHCASHASCPVVIVRTQPAEVTGSSPPPTTAEEWSAGPWN